MIEELNEILQYVGARKSGNKALYTEFSLVNSRINKLQWQLLTQEQKQDKRRSLLKVIKKHKEEDGLETFYYENALIKLYDLFLLLKKEVILLHIKKE